ncbi:hypothetical protein [Holospora undulata]|uniref:Uncharacterized protein n=1 Tax=Holospora undulata HU1 TaxID=1321371 RepID=A0A061JGU2_9PROT|nr:hypothetical protein [Holospora undulata]ETZ05305.1 hypothetical protein K737_300263 [Holospora undulata HU1]
MKINFFRVILAMMICTAVHAEPLEELAKSVNSVTEEIQSVPISFEQKQEYTKKVAGEFLNFIQELKQTRKNLVENFVYKFFEKLLELEIDEQLRVKENEEKKIKNFYSVESTGNIQKLNANISVLKNEKTGYQKKYEALKNSKELDTQYPQYQKYFNHYLESLEAIKKSDVVEIQNSEVEKNYVPERRFATPDKQVQQILDEVSPQRLDTAVNQRHKKFIARKSFLSKLVP